MDINALLQMLQQRFGQGGGGNKPLPVAPCRVDSRNKESKSSLVSN